MDGRGVDLKRVGAEPATAGFEDREVGGGAGDKPGDGIGCRKPGLLMAARPRAVKQTGISVHRRSGTEFCQARWSQNGNTTPPLP